MFPNLATVLRLLGHCSLQKTQHTGKTRRELQRQGDPSRRFPFTRFLMFHLFVQFGEEVEGPALHSTLKWLTPLKPGVPSRSAVPAHATPGQEGPVTTVAVTSNTGGGFSATCKLIHARYKGLGSKALLL